MPSINKNEFVKRFITIPIDKIASKPKYTDPQHLLLPDDAMIHFISDSDSELGIDKSYCLLRNALSQTFIFHVVTLKHEIGNVSPTNVNSTNLARSYQKSHLDIKSISNLDRSISTNHSPIVMNYGLLPRLYKYSTNNLVVYQEWFNIRNTMWDNISQISLRREHFIRYKLPQVLPNKNELGKYLEEFKSSGLSDFHTNEGFDLLELWRMIHPGVVSPITKLTDDAIEHVNLVFIEQGVMAIIRLQDLMEWSQEDPIAAASGLYKFFDILISLRSPVDTKAVIEETKEDGHVKFDDSSTLHKLIKAHAEAGNLSEAEQKGLLKLSQRYTKIQDPKGSGLTLDKLVVSKDDLKLGDTRILADNKVITDKSMLSSTVNAIEQRYVKNVMHKDIVQSTLMLQNAGIIIKDLKVKRKIDCANRMDEYSVQLQPVAGEASTIHFTIPVVDPDGSFLSGNVKYRMDRQKGEMPIVKTKPNQVALTSYYGKIFVGRTETAVNNYAKWIFKKISAIADDKEDNRITNLVYGINTINHAHVPRPYTAVSEAVDSFIINKDGLSYQMYFGYNKMSTLFNKEDIQKAEANEMVLCGKHIGTDNPLAMDVDGKIYVLWHKDIRSPNAGQIELLGTLPFLMGEITDGPIEYTEFSLLNDRCPIIMALCYMYGLDKTLNDLNIKFTLQPTNAKLHYDPDTFRLKFKDIIYVIDISNKYHKLLVGGFSVLKNTSTKYKGSDFNNQAIYGSIFHSFGLAIYQMRELSLLWDMYIEPITKGLLEEMGQPTNFRDLLLHTSDLLVNDYIPDTNNTRYKGYERMCGIMYRELVNAMRSHRSQGVMTNVGVSLNPRAVQLSILSDQTIGLVEESNPIQNVKEKQSFTHSGSGGRSVTTMVKNTRGFTNKDLGVISEATPDSGKVGVRAFLTPNANLTSVRGTSREYDEKTDGPSTVISCTSLLAPAVTHDNAQRVNYINVQMAHGVACDNYNPLPYRTGYEEVLSGQVDDLFVVTAEADGTVTDVTDKYLTVEYDQKPIAVIVKGNPKFINDPKLAKLAEKFYGDIEARLVKLGYEVEYDAGEPYTSPNGKAAVWIGHSRGKDRLQFAPKEIKTIALITKDGDYYDKAKAAAKTPEELEVVMNNSGNDPKHYELAAEDIKNIDVLKHGITGRKAVYELGIYHGTVSGHTIPHTRITDMKKGQKFKKTNALIFNSGFFQRSELNPENVVYKAGIIARTAFFENSSTYEDGCVISEDIAHKLSTPATTLHGVIVDYNTVVHNLVSIGDKVEPETILCTLENFISDDLEAKDAEAIHALTKLAANNPKAKTYGVITEIEVVYYGSAESMHPSLQKIVTKYDTLRAKRVNALGLDSAKTGRVTETIRVAGSKLLENQIAIKIYIDGEIAMGAGDKLVFANQLKSTCSRVETNTIITENNEVIDAAFGYLSISNRVVGSAERAGLANSVLKKLSLEMGNRFKNK